MVGTLSATITGHTAGGLVYTLSFTQTVADSATAQTILNGVKTFLQGGSTIDNVSAQFTPQSTGLS